MGEGVRGGRGCFENAEGRWEAGEGGEYGEGVIGRGWDECVLNILEL